MDNPKEEVLEALESKLDGLVKSLQDLDSYLTGEVYKYAENCPQVVDRLFTKLNRCTSAATSIAKIVHQLT